MPTDISFYCKASVAPEKAGCVRVRKGWGVNKEGGKEGRRDRVQWEEWENLLKSRDGARSLSKCILIGGTLMSRAIHLPSPCNERSRGRDQGRSGEGGGKNGDGGMIQRLHVALPHYAAVRQRAAWRQRGLGSPQTGSGATIPAWTSVKGDPAMPLSRRY